TLTWTNPANSAFDHIEITINPGGTTRKVKKGEGEQSYTWAGLSSGTEYTFTVKTFDKDGNITVTEVKVRLEEDKTPPGPVTNLAAVDGGFGSVELNWKNPSDADLQYVEITCEPSSGKARTVNAAPLANGTYTWAGLAGGLTYTFTLKAVDHSGNRSAEASASGTPLDLTPPAAVTNLKAAPGDGYVVLTWTDPGDADLDYIQIECNEIAGPAKIVSKGVQGYTWDTGEYWYEPFTNYTAYTFTVATRDLTGNLGPAATVGPVIPPGTLAQRIAAAASGDTIYLYADEAIPAAIGIGKTIILIGDSAERTLSIDGYSGSMFNVTAGGSLTLDDKVTLKGKSGNNAAVVNVNGGSFVIKDGSQISGNNAATGGGVYVASGTFTMEGGTISGNNAVAGGGVYVGGGTFSMTGGEIKANKATNVPSGWGGGVAITNTGNAAFSKTGGTIYGNNGNENRNKAGNVGQAVRVYSTVSRDTTAGPEINLFYNGTTASGDW
ncbi:MAG: DUF4959 domain-containing protein, partial [Treponema sp.]|nr:DUF4959 domain-containing protein [Treponema sp.]